MVQLSVAVVFHRCPTNRLGLIRNANNSNPSPCVNRNVAAKVTPPYNAVALVIALPSQSTHTRRLALTVTLQLGGLLVDQMSLAAQQIGEAAKKLQELLDQAKLEQSGLQLNVNESILAGSKALMDCIRVCHKERVGGECTGA